MLIRDALLAGRYAPAGHRLRLACQFLASSERQYQSSVPEKCEIDSLDQFESACAQLATVLGRSGKIPSPEHAKFFRSLSSRAKSFAGTIGGSDSFFVTAFVSILVPERVIEIGTLTGFSAAVLASAIIRERGYEGHAVVDTIDCATECCVAANRSDSKSHTS